MVEQGQISVIHRIKRPHQFSVFEFCTLAGLRAKQLGRGCLPKVDGGHKLAVTALLEVAAGRVVRAEDDEVQHSPRGRSPDPLPANVGNRE